jgi:hypothetical protein
LAEEVVVEVLLLLQTAAAVLAVCAYKQFI